MKLSKRGEYALRALIDFGIAYELGRPLLKIGELVEKERLPVKFLEQILTQLRGAGYIETKRGKAGGYFLAKPPKQISLGQVIRLIDGPLAPISCVSVTAYERCSCPDEAHCGLRMLMLDVRNAIARILDRYVLGDVVDITLRKMRRDNVPIPFIVEKLLGPSTPRSGEPGFVDDFPLGGFLAELEESKSDKGTRPPARPKARGKAPGKK
ncbi:transcriptional regulator, BadM/Rrf2 family [Chthoniobacter flavus Ellin428]|uniref:Transcriptional regulator, BadM/Rrf2 family n=1 Tax=Chthoniobacter flavus Ellin428 TaxID=497964 RepID=B4CUB3_9BACT|nr:Rrf2 family transcriptional regulator [Chthoniobacter flavus]EDY22151.1 transcriptional regulator, BadM/Rrf2 family [Chthoniobacter flavus Ellin428]TCO94816.1 BadM/Rrf2 family transcriptional regulator [Chthoniobacter flavus]